MIRDGADTGTIRTYDEHVRELIHRDSRMTAEKIAESAGAKADVLIAKIYDTTVNNERLAEWARPVLQRATDGRVSPGPLVEASEDFSFFAEATPGLFIFMGITPRGQDPATAAPNHSPGLNHGVPGSELSRFRIGTVIDEARPRRSIALYAREVLSSLPLRERRRIV